MTEPSERLNKGELSFLTHLMSLNPTPMSLRAVGELHAKALVGEVADTRALLQAPDLPRRIALAIHRADCGCPDEETTDEPDEYYVKLAAPVVELLTRLTTKEQQ